MAEYFVKEWSGENNGKVSYLMKEKELWEFLQKVDHKKVTVYRGECILDWS